jgi:DNA-binding NarL/FixJ family response regulator
VRVVLADDSTLLREGLVRLLTEEGHEVVGAVGDATALLKAVGAERPDVVVVEVRMRSRLRSRGRRSGGCWPARATGTCWLG